MSVPAVRSTVTQHHLFSTRRINGTCVCCVEHRAVVLPGELRAARHVRVHRNVRERDRGDVRPNLRAAGDLINTRHDIVLQLQRHWHEHDISTNKTQPFSD